MSLKAIFSGDWSALKKTCTDAVNGVKAAGSKMESAFSGLKGVAAGALAFAGIGLGTAELKKLIAEADNLGKTSRNIGITTDQLQGLRYAAESVNFPVEQIEPAFAKLKKLIGDAENGSTEAARKFGLMGIKLEELKGKTPYEQFRLVAEAISMIEDPTERTTAAMNIFGEQGQKALEFLASFEQASADLAARGQLIDAEQIKNAEEFSQLCTDIQKSLQAWTINSGFLQSLKEIAEGLAAIATNASRLKSMGGTEKKESRWRTAGRWALNGLGGLPGVALAGGWRMGDKLLPDNSTIHVPADPAPAVGKRESDRALQERRQAVIDQTRAQEAEAKKAEEAKKAAEAAKRKAEEEEKAARRVSDQVNGYADQVRYAQLKARGLSREAEIQKALDQARKAKGSDLTPQEVRRISAAAGAAYDIANIRSVPVPQWNPEELKDSLNRIGGYNGSQGRPTVSPEQYAKMSADRLKTIADRANEIANNLKLSEESGPKFP